MLVLLACHGEATEGAGERPPVATLVLEHATVVDADGARAGDVVIDGDTIVAIGGPWAGDPEVVDATGMWVTPGLADPHVHLATAGTLTFVGDPLDANLRALLYHGVLAAMDLGGPEALFDLRDAIDAGEAVGPTLRATGPFLTAEGSHPCETFPDPDLCTFVDADSAEAVARARLDAGADAIKVAVADAAFSDWPTPRIDPAAVAAAASVGAPVFAHVDTNLDAADAVAAGAGVLAHPVFGEPLDDDGLAASLDADAVLSTVGAFAAVGAVLDGTRDLDDPDLVVADGVIDAWAAVRADPGVLLDGWVDASADWAAQARATLVALHEAGARVVPGSDAGYYFVPHGTGLHDELATMEALGWTPAELLAAATVDAREVMGLPGGRVAPGEPADLLVLRSDPTVDAAALDDIDAVVLRGRRLTRDEILAIDLVDGGGTCLEDADCAEGRCDRVAHVCAEACDPAYATSNGCGAADWCMPADGLASGAGVCHPGDACDLYAQDCAPASYAMACIPLDADTNECWYGGPRGEGDRCGFDAADACAPGLYCSLGRCARLCDPDGADTCGRPLTCSPVTADDGSPWFGLCL